MITMSPPDGPVRAVGLAARRFKAERHRRGVLGDENQEGHHQHHDKHRGHPQDVAEVAHAHVELVSRVVGHRHRVFQPYTLGRSWWQLRKLFDVLVPRVVAVQNRPGPRDNAADGGVHLVR